MWNSSVVVLNKYDEFMGETTVKRAIKKLINERATLVASSDKYIREDFRMPIIIRMKYFDYYRYKKETVPYSDKQVFIRDDNICQYYHEYILTESDDGKKIHIPAEKHIYKCKEHEKTIDHIIPVSKGGKRGDFENAVCCCRYCNETLKRNSTPKEAGMHLVREPVKPVRKKGDIARVRFFYDNTKESHRKYIEIYPWAIK